MDSKNQSPAKLPKSSGRGKYPHNIECIISSTCDSDISLSGSEYVPETEDSSLEESDNSSPLVSPPVKGKTAKFVTGQPNATITSSDNSLPSIKRKASKLVTVHPNATITSSDDYFPSVKKVSKGSTGPLNVVSSSSDSSVNSPVSTPPSYGENIVLGVEKKAKKNCCYYCGKLVSKIGRHLQSHATEKEIIEISSKKNKREKTIALKELRLLGNYRYNLDCLERGSGNIIVMRAPTFNCRATDFIPCPSCFGFVYKRELYKHCRECPFKLEGAISNPMDEAKLLLMPKHLTLQGSDELNRCILNKLRNGSVKKKILDDPLIIAFGQSQMKRLRAAKGDKHSYLSQRLRLLGRLLIECERISSCSVSLDDLCKPENFDLLIRTVQNMTEAESKPKSTGLKIGMVIRKCCVLAKCLAIKSANNIRRTQADDFLALMDGEWSDLLSSSLLRELYDKKLNKDTVLPVTSDLMKLNSLINERICKATQDISVFPSEENYFKLAKVTLCKIIVFNKRRSGEVSRISVADYLKRPDWSSKQNEEICKSMSELEKKLADRLDMIKVSGKRGRHVPILLTRDVVRAMDLLVRDRCHVNIKDSNKYFFATTGDKYLRGHEVLHAIAQEAGLSNPSAMTSTNLRKYVATVSQIIALDKEELEWLADHLGHSIEVHRDFYRLQESTLEMSKVSKLLMAIESGSIHKFAGKKLSDIDVEHCFDGDDCRKLISQDGGSRELQAHIELSELQVERIEDDELLGETENYSELQAEVNECNESQAQNELCESQAQNERCEPQAQNERCEPQAQNELCEPQAQNELSEPQAQNELCEPHTLVDKYSEPQSVNDEYCGPQTQNEHCELQSQNKHSFDVKNSRKCKKGKKKWDPKVKNNAFRFFKKFLLSHQVPGKKECLNFIDIYEVKDRQWKDVKNLLYNEVRKKK